ncbi:MAG: hypothetical protein KME19_17990 [Microcoleus vaginatus WJT46-NPBG5]|nr:hypothetical protein [Microcoleus vaginatus WJT46-NPBG5]
MSDYKGSITGKPPQQGRVCEVCEANRIRLWEQPVKTVYRVGMFLI